MGFGSAKEYATNLDNSFIRLALERNLYYIKLISSNMDDLGKRYGIKTKARES
jgi:hypothetical protein